MTPEARRDASLVPVLPAAGRDVEVGQIRRTPARADEGVGGDFGEHQTAALPWPY